MDPGNATAQRGRGNRRKQPNCCPRLWFLGLHKKHLPARKASARAYFYPSLTLTAEGGLQSLDVEDMLNPESIFYNLIAGVTQPLFARGQNEARFERREAQQQVLTAQQNLLVAQLSRVNARLDQLVASVDLYQALGGRWDRAAHPIAPEQEGGEAREASEVEGGE